MSADAHKSVMIVTGASSGIGACLALRAAADGYALLLVARRAERLQHVAERAASLGAPVRTVIADVTAADAAARIVSAATEAFGRIDVIVHNAGTGAPGTLLEQSDADVQRQFSLHVLAPLRLSRAALPLIKMSRGVLAFVGSGLARVPAPGFGAYNLAKAAIRAAAGQLRRELKADGIAICYIDPGAVNTEFSEASGMERAAGAKLADPDGVAAAILRGIKARRFTINAVPWQTVGTAVGEWFPALADPIIERVVDTPKQELPAQSQPVEVAAEEPETAEDPIDVALGPLLRRMERTKLSRAFVTSLLVANGTIEFNETAMRWAGMPNKNERALLREVLDALTTAGFLEVRDDDRWAVVQPLSEPAP